MLKKVHHINLLVNDLDSAVRKYQLAFEIDHFEYGDLDARGVKTARFKAGETWIVLIEPIDPDGVPAKHLAEHGEGLFLLSFEVESLEAASAKVESNLNGLGGEGPRTGLEGWQVRDLDPTIFNGAILQLTQDDGA
ncbi:lactoylglutathione lyase [Halioglobus maricola]|uniref:Lactoylglutathione lyase n=1 Tax=Halioglobus maricola TaxID=2601894 RepID=A0A5P9NH74_9GAMM|nr:VOC family protein [Halioglobus maricola]QFU74378.1 lactoylglutathione lyase [Halioglobus maricola]